MKGNGHDYAKFCLVPSAIIFMPPRKLMPII